MTIRSTSVITYKSCCGGNVALLYDGKRFGRNVALGHDPLVTEHFGSAAPDCVDLEEPIAVAG